MELPALGRLKFVQCWQCCHALTGTSQQRRQIDQQFVYQTRAQQRAVEFVTGFYVNFIVVELSQVLNHSV